jgi:capsular exopolysaccharide synthesis family protein
MSRLYDVLGKKVLDVRVPRQPSTSIGSPTSRAVHVFEEAPRAEAPTAIEQGQPLSIRPSPELRLVALAESNGIGAEKFRALVTRLAHVREERELRSVQVASSVALEGKTVVAANLAVTLAKYSGSRTLLVEGNLRRPVLAGRLGLRNVHGLSDWWSSPNAGLEGFVHRLEGMPLWILAGGSTCDQPSRLLQSARFAESFGQLVRQFEWIIVDSTPILPVVDANLWSTVVDGTLLVVRENVAPIKALKKGLESMDRPKLVGMVVNESMPLAHGDRDGPYCVAAPEAQTPPPQL